jgi:hypothetical protein
MNRNSKKVPAESPITVYRRMMASAGASPLTTPSLSSATSASTSTFSAKSPAATAVAEAANFSSSSPSSLPARQMTDAALEQALQAKANALQQKYMALSSSSSSKKPAVLDDDDIATAASNSSTTAMQALDDNDETTMEEGIPMDGLVSGATKFIHKRTHKNNEKKLEKHKRKGEKLEKKYQKSKSKLSEDASEIISLAQEMRKEGNFAALPPVRPLGASVSASTSTVMSSSSPSPSPSPLLSSEVKLAEIIVPLVQRGQYSRVSDITKSYENKQASPHVHLEANLALGTAMSCARYACENNGARGLHSNMKKLLDEGEKVKMPLDTATADKLAAGLRNYVTELHEHVQNLASSESVQKKLSQERGTLLGRYLMAQLDKTFKGNDLIGPLCLASLMTDLVSITQTSIAADSNETRHRLFGFWNSSQSSFESHALEFF